LLARELAEEGASPAVLSLVTRASSDEVRHAEICKRLVTVFLGEHRVPNGFRGLPRVPMYPVESASDRVLFHVTEMCCLSETLTCVFLSEMLARATHPVTRAAIESLLEDEVDHGRVGWAYLAERARKGTAGALADALAPMVERTFGPVLSAPRPTSEQDRKLETCGYLGSRTTYGIYANALRAVILPGFEKVGIDTGVLLTMLRERVWTS
jgi:hypothetical protein